MKKIILVFVAVMTGLISTAQANETTYSGVLVEQIDAITDRNYIGVTLKTTPRQVTTGATGRIVRVCAGKSRRVSAALMVDMLMHAMTNNVVVSRIVVDRNSCISQIKFVNELSHGDNRFVEERIENPMQGDRRLDRCENLGERCEGQAANRYCQFRYGSAVVTEFQREFVTAGTGTRTIRDQECNGSRCGAYRYIICGYQVE